MNIGKTLRCAAKPAFGMALALILACGLLPVQSFAGDFEGGGTLLSQSERSSSSDDPSTTQEVDQPVQVPAPMLASALASDGSIVSADVSLDADETIVGSFTFGGLTFAVNGEGVTLVAVSPDVILGVGETADYSVILSEGEAGVKGSLSIPPTISYDGISYDVTAVGPYAFYLSGVTQVDLPASVSDIDERTFRSSDVAWANIAEASSSYASYDGAIYGADETRILLVPEGRSGQLRISSLAEWLDPEVFSHCASLASLSVDADCPTFSSWEGLLYDADGTTLLRVPAGATDITIREGCTTVAAGAMEGCAKLERINAPSTVTSISPNVFEFVPTVSLPAMTLQDDPVGASFVPAQSERSAEGATPNSVILSDDAAGVEGSSENETEESPSQLSAMVALAAHDSLAPVVEPKSITVYSAENEGLKLWRTAGFLGELLGEGGYAIPIADLSSASTYAGENRTLTMNANGGELRATVINSTSSSAAPWSTTSSKSVGILNAYIAFSSNSLDYIEFSAGYTYRVVGFRTGYHGDGWKGTYNASSGTYSGFENLTETIQWAINTYTVELDPRGGVVSPETIAGTYNQNLTLPIPDRGSGYRFLGWDTSPDGTGTRYQPGTAKNLTADHNVTVPLYAHWTPIEYPVTFNLGSYPSGHDAGTFSEAGWGDVNTFTVEDGTVTIPTPVRAGMRFLGWESNVDGLVSQSGTTWSIDCTKLPDATNPTLTARWAYAVSVDSPVAVTFGEYDLATNRVTVGGAENGSGLSDEWDVDAKAGSPVSFRSQSLCDVGIEGIESESREGVSLIKATAGETGDASVREADLITMKVGAGEADSRNEVSFALDDALGKAAMAPKTAFLIPAGGELSASFRLNLEECGAYISDDDAGPEPESVDLAQLSYAYRAIPYGTGSASDDMYIPYDAANPFGLADIKAAANDIALRGEGSEWWWVYAHLMYRDERDKTNAKVKVSSAYHDVQILGLGQDRLTTPTDGREVAGLTFGWRDIYAYNNTKNQVAGGGAFSTIMTTAANNAQGWNGTQMRNAAMRTTFWGSLPDSMREAILPVNKFQQLTNYNGATEADLQASRGETIWLPSMYEVYGVAVERYNESEGMHTVPGYEPFQYQVFSDYKKEGTARFFKQFNGIDTRWVFRTADRTYINGFLGVGDEGAWRSMYPLSAATIGVVPCFCL